MKKHKATNRKRAAAVVGAAPCSASWYAESQFWWTKCQRARIRLEKAQECGDEKAAEIAKKQFDLYKRRFDAAIPKEVQDEWAAEDAAETKAAMEE